MSDIILTEQTTPTTPATGKWVLYCKTDGLYYLDDTGTETGPLDVGGAGGALDDLTDVDLTGLAQGNILYYNGTSWIVLAPGTNGYFLKTQGAAANPIWASVPGGTLASLTDVDLTGIAQGDVLYYNGTDWVVLAPGTNGYFLKTQGAAANPVWASVPGGGDMLAANNLSDVATPATAFANIKQAATTTATGVVELATDGESAANVVVQGNDARLSNARTPSAHASSHISTGSDPIAAAVAAGASGLMTGADKTKLDGIETAADVTDATNVNTAGAVMESDYNAQTILAATSDNTPAALTVGEQTVVGRITSGNIAALSVSQLATLVLSAALPENTAIILDYLLSADGTYSGIITQGVAGATLAFGNLCYLSAADTRWEKADADASATSGPVLLGMCVLAAASDGSTTYMLLYGKIRADAAFPTLTVGAPAFVGTTEGEIQTTAPSGTGDIIRIVGQGCSTGNELFFCPSNDYYKHV